MAADVKRNELLKHIDLDSIEIEKVVNPKRIYKFNNIILSHKPVIYLMDREQRVCDNWALVFSQQLALEIKQPIVVLFFLDITKKIYSRQLDFMLKGLDKVKEELKEKNIEFRILLKTEEEYIDYLKGLDVGCLITDFSPLYEHKKLSDLISKNCQVSFYEVDSHNIVPCRYISDKQEYSAATIRPKVKRLISEFLTEYPELEKHPYSLLEVLKEEALDFALIEDRSVSPINWLEPSSLEAKKELNRFIEEKLDLYNENRNDPTKDYLSNMSVYLHFGQISAQRIALDVIRLQAPNKSKESYLEELIVRKELSDNFCFYNSDYKNNSSFPYWAQVTLNGHKQDIRTYDYSLKDFEQANTQDQLWNAAQLELLKKGKIHSYMRMYWCKKILEWTKSPEEAQEIAIHLNDKYSLDGLDPNGYVGIGWSIGGVHDRAWTERSVFGKIRYMNYDGCKRKFDVNLYISIMENIQ